MQRRLDLLLHSDLIEGLFRGERREGRIIHYLALSGIPGDKMSPSYLYKKYARYYLLYYYRTIENRGQ